MLCTVAVALQDVPAPGLGDALVMQDNYDWGRHTVSLCISHPGIGTVSAATTN
jgi:hypothetical protein